VFSDFKLLSKIGLGVKCQLFCAAGLDLVHEAAHASHARFCLQTSIVLSKVVFPASAMPLAIAETEKGMMEPAAVEAGLPVATFLRLPVDAAPLPPDAEAGRLPVPEAPAVDEPETHVPKAEAGCPPAPEAPAMADPETHVRKSKLPRGSNTAKIIADYMSAGPLAKKQKPATPC